MEPTPPWHLDGARGEPELDLSVDYEWNGMADDPLDPDPEDTAFATLSRGPA